MYTAPLTTETHSPLTPLGVFVRKHALPLYFCLVFLISWVFWIVEPSLRVRDGLSAGLLIKVGTYGPIYGSPLNGILMQMVSTVPLAVIFTWLYNRSQGSLLVMVLLHTSINVTSGIIAPAAGMFITTTIAVVLMVIFDRMYRSLPVEKNLGACLP